jgi:hypothetical protein
MVRDMPDNPTDERTQSTADIDAGWGELLDGIGHSHPVEVAPADAEPEPIDEQEPRELDVAQKRSANEMLAQMARMLDVREGTGPVVDLRRVLAPKLEGASTPLSAPSPAPLVPPRFEEEPLPEAEIETPPAVDKLPPSERTLVTRRLRDDAPLLHEILPDGPHPIDATEDAPRLLALSDGVPLPIVEREESWPRRDTPKPRPRTGESSAVNRRVGDTGSVRRASESSATNARVDTGPGPVARTRSQWPWIAGAAALVLAIGWAALRPSPAPERDMAQASAAPPSRTGDAAAAALADTRAPSRAAEAQPTTTRKAEPAAPAPTPAVADATVEAPATPAATAPAKPEVDVDAKPEPAATKSTAAIEGSPGELLAGADAAFAEKRFDDAHDLARRSWDAEHGNDAVRLMALAACELQDGALARSAFRKLKGQETRTEVYGVCRGLAVDVRSSIDGYTPAELLVKATRALERGEHESAYDFARQSNKIKHTTAAMTMMATCACHKRDADDAAHFLGMLPKAKREEVAAACKSAGVELPPP